MARFAGQPAYNARVSRTTESALVCHSFEAVGHVGAEDIWNRLAYIRHLTAYVSKCLMHVREEQAYDEYVGLSPSVSCAERQIFKPIAC